MVIYFVDGAIRDANENNILTQQEDRSNKHMRYLKDHRKYND